MIPVVCHCNLDLERCEKWPKYLPAMPQVGNLIESAHAWTLSDGKSKLRLELEVSSVAWKYIEKESLLSSCDSHWECHVELSLPKIGSFKHTVQFELWYKKIQGKISIEEYQKESLRFDN